MERSALYQERFKRFDDVLQGNIPDRVPVFPIIEQWAMQTFGISIRECYLDDPLKSVEAYRKVYEQVYVDATYGDGNLKPIKMISEFGEGLYTVTDKGVQIKGTEDCVMKEDEYPQFLEDPIDFMNSVIVARKFPFLANSSLDECAEAWFRAFVDFGAWAQHNGITAAAIEEQLEVPVIAKGGGILSPDLFFDYIRGFAGATVDVRRRPEQFIAACQALDPVTIGFLCSSPDKSGITFIPQHMATYISPKLYEKCYFPFMQSATKALHEDGRIPCYYSENDWTPYLDSLLDLHDGAIMCIFEKGDLPAIKKKIGKKIIVGGGMPIDMLMMATEEECIDRAKWCLDNLASDGGYIFGLDKNIINDTDAKIENLAAVCNYIHENGKY